MDLRQLRVLLAVVEKGSLGRAAEWLHTSQPAVTKTIQRLEEELDVTLFDRDARGMRPTQFAECLATHARSISIGVSQAIDDVKSLKRGAKGTVTIGSPPLVATEILPPIIIKLVKEHPGLQIRIITASDAVSERIMAGEFDFGLDLLGAAGSDSGLMQRLLFNDRLVLIARQGHPIARLSTPTPQELQSYQWILPAPGNRHRGRLVQLFELAGLTPPTAAIECSTTEFLKAIVRQTDYIGIIAKISLHPKTNAGDRKLKVIEIDSPSMSRPLGLVWRQSQVLTPAMRLTMGAIEEFCRQIGSDEGNQARLRASQSAINGRTL
jgi:DNA-binding transcriptional LysR family regulator